MAAPIRVGAVTWPDHGTSAEDLLRRAETALAVAVKRRETWVDYRPAIDSDQADVRLIERFLANRGADLYPVFQPQIDVRSGEVVGAEALVRWDAPGYGPVSPGKFIPLLEESGLVRHVTARMLDEAVRMSAQLRRAGTPCPISVNVAVSDLVTGDEVRETIFAAIDAHGGFVGDLKLELTETSAAERLETVRVVMNRLRDGGVRLAIDDYGTGYASLSYLGELPIHEVKIDQSFIQGVESKPHAQSIVRSTISMAHELGLLVVAEGVETEEALAFLRDQGCDRAQGFLISKPLIVPMFMQFVRCARVAGAGAGGGAKVVALRA